MMQGLGSKLNISDKLKSEINRKKMAKATDFYVHDLLATIRPEDVPEACKERRLVRERKEVFTHKDWFRDFKDDNVETVMQCAINDSKMIRYE